MSYNKILLSIAILLFALPIAYAFLGIYEPGEKIHYSYICLDNDSRRDISCIYVNDSILAPNETSTFEPDSAITNLSGTNLPGLWRGNYTVPSGGVQGTWGIYISINNSDNIKTTTVLHFQVVGDTHGIDSIGANTVTSLSNEATLTSEHSSILTGTQSNTTFLNTNLGNNLTDVMTNQSNIKSAVDTANIGIQRNTTYLEGNLSTINNFLISMNSSLENGTLEIQNRLGNPLGNGTNIWDYIYGDLSSTSSVNLLYRIWNYGTRLISGVITRG